MPAKTFINEQSQTIKINIPQPAEMDSFFAFGVHKSGSTLLEKILIYICSMKNIPTINYSSEMFKRGEILTKVKPEDSIFDCRGYAYIGFRIPWQLQESGFDFQRTKNIFLVRDPRDALTSNYYSTAYSHTIPKSGPLKNEWHKRRSESKYMPIDQFVLEETRIKRVIKILQDYMSILPASTTRIYRYEDIIFYKEEWIKDMLNYLELELEDEQVKEIVRKVDVIPDQEKQDQHIRQVVPGNYKKHLKEETITQLNRELSPVLQQFHYDSVLVLKPGEQ